MRLDIETQLVKFVQATSASSSKIDIDTDLLMTDVLDSLLLIELVVVIENIWGVTLQGDDIAPRNFRCIRQLATLIDSRRPDDLLKENAAA